MLETDDDDGRSRREAAVADVKKGMAVVWQMLRGVQQISGHLCWAGGGH
jgi:ferric iron reductase protein FhuF